MGKNSDPQGKYIKPYLRGKSDGTWEEKGLVATMRSSQILERLKTN